jgi:hypothetical protein
MPDDERPDGRDPEVASRLAVEPLDDVTRRRLVSTALRETAGDATAATPTARSHAWRWIAVAAAVVVVLVGGLAILIASGGHDEQATRALSPRQLDQALSVAPDVGDFGNLDDAVNAAALRSALDARSKTSAEAAAPRAASGDAAVSTPPASGASCARGAVGTVVARATGTLDGRRVTVVLLEGADGTRSVDALFEDSCELRHLATIRQR